MKPLAKFKSKKGALKNFSFIYFKYLVKHFTMCKKKQASCIKK